MGDGTGRVPQGAYEGAPHDHNVITDACGLPRTEQHEDFVHGPKMVFDLDWPGLGGRGRIG